MQNFIHDEYTRKALQLAEEGKSFFITGKAGTGKTMLLREIYNTLKPNKKIIICAPTGVAAKNAGGSTLHSQFRIPITIYLPNHKIRGLYNLNDNEAELLRRLDVLIIDEISMVRCDIIDMLDKILKYYRENDKPFGGVQVIMFGDMRQLMPVATDEDWQKLKSSYKASYFFCSEVLSKFPIPILELVKVHRQTDTKFISLLNSLRDGKLSYQEKLSLDNRFQPDYLPSDRLKYIFLTTHRYRATKINSEKLEILKTPEYQFKAYTTGGYIRNEDVPADWYLKLKEGARVMFITNDNISRQYINGTLGIITHLSHNQIIVRTDDGKEINVERASWDYYRYTINKRTKEIERELLARFHQYPLRLAWAITIHKSQGLTFDKVLIDAGKAFTYGQVYVALSRCRTLDGIVLKSQISQDVVTIDPIVTEYLQLAERIWPDEVETNNSDSNITDNEAVSEFLRTTKYNPIGTVFQIKGDDNFYDAWECASPQVYCIDKIEVNNNHIQRVCVAQYHEDSIAFEIIDNQHFHKLKNINYYGGQCSETEIYSDNTISVFNFKGKNYRINPDLELKSRPQIIDQKPKQRKYSFERKDGYVIITKHSITTKQNNPIKEYSDLGKLLLSCKSCYILRDTPSHYIVAVTTPTYKLLKFSLEGNTTSDETKFIIDKWYRSSNTTILESYSRTYTQDKFSLIVKETYDKTKKISHNADSRLQKEPTQSIVIKNNHVKETSLSSDEIQILKILRNQGAMKAETLALFTKKSKAEINHILNDDLKTKGLVSCTGLFWRVK